MKKYLLSLRDNPSVHISYPLINNVTRINDYNLSKMNEFTKDQAYVVPNQNILVGLLQTLAIDPEWELGYLTEYVRLRSKSICSAYQINSPNNIGKVNKDIAVYCGCDEYLSLIEFEKDYDFDKLKIEDLNPLVPLYSTLNIYSYNPPVELITKPQMDLTNEIVILGVNFVELALGWWLFMKDTNNDGLGIHTYIAKTVFNKFRLLLNEWSIFNYYYNYFVKEENIQSLFRTENVEFNTMNIENKMEDFLTYQFTKLKNYPIRSSDWLLSLLNSQLTPNLYYLFDDKDCEAIYSGTMLWTIEAKYIKYSILYMALMNDNGKEADLIKGNMQRIFPLIKQRYQQMGDNSIVLHLKGLLDLGLKLANSN